MSINFDALADLHAHYAHQRPMRPMTVASDDLLGMLFLRLEGVHLDEGEDMPHEEPDEPGVSCWHFIGGRIGTDEEIFLCGTSDGRITYWRSLKDDESEGKGLASFDAWVASGVAPSNERRPEPC